MSRIKNIEFHQNFIFSSTSTFSPSLCKSFSHPTHRFHTCTHFNHPFHAMFHLFLSHSFIFIVELDAVEEIEVPWTPTSTACCIRLYNEIKSTVINAFIKKINFWRNFILSVRHSTVKLFFSRFGACLYNVHVYIQYTLV